MRKRRGGGGKINDRISIPQKIVTYSSCTCTSIAYNRIMIAKSITSSEARSSLYSILREVVEDAVPVVIRHRGHKNAVIVSEDEYNSLVETAYITGGRNGEALRRSMQDAREGKTRRITLEEIDALID